MALAAAPEKKGHMTLPDAKLELVPADLIPRAQQWFHHPGIQARVAQAEAEFAEGRSTRTSTPRQAKAFLDRLKARAPTER
jgi:hypothetical protein